MHLSDNCVAVVQSIKSYRYDPAALGSVNSNHQNGVKFDLRHFSCGMVVGAGKATGQVHKCCFLGIFMHSHL